MTQVNEGGLVVQRLTPPDDEGVAFRAVKRLPLTLDALKPVLIDCQHFKAFMPHTIKSDRTDKAPNKALCDVVVDLPFPFDDLRSLVLAEWGPQDNGSWQRKWSLVSGSFYRNEGRWVLLSTPDAQHTYILYDHDAIPFSIILTCIGINLVHLGLLLLLLIHTQFYFVQISIF